MTFSTYMSVLWICMLHTYQNDLIVPSIFITIYPASDVGNLSSFDSCDFQKNLILLFLHRIKLSWSENHYDEKAAINKHFLEYNLRNISSFVLRTIYRRLSRWRNTCLWEYLSASVCIVECGDYINQSYEAKTSIDFILLQFTINHYFNISLSFLCLLHLTSTYTGAIAKSDNYMKLDCHKLINCWRQRNYVWIALFLT